MSQGGLFAIVVLCIISALALGAFLVIRGIYRFKDWRNGDTNELWNFLSLTIGAAGLFILAISSIPFLGSPAPDYYDTFARIFTLSLSLLLGSIALTTYHLFLKWSTEK
ncbi:MAG: hypothetical protein HWN66_00990 [Candidatus Helarchaeota archaeon]|nr:hypothetical protein [Candidatus Helarchaeota archaeon]